MADEGYFEKVDREAEAMREEVRASLPCHSGHGPALLILGAPRRQVKPFTEAYQGQIKLLDLSGEGQTDCQALQTSPELTICLMSSNAILQIENLQACRHLRKLDLSDNKIQALPNAATWSHLVQLEVLHLHTNNIQSLENVKEMAALPRLTIISLYRNPIALHPFYRAQIIRAMVSTLRCVSPSPLPFVRARRRLRKHAEWPLPGTG